MNKIAEEAVVGQFRGKNVFDGFHESPHNFSSLQKNPTVFYPPEVEKDSSWL